MSDEEKEKRIEELLRGEETPPPPPDLLDRIRSEIPTDLGKTGKPGRRLNQGWAIAAALFVVIGGAWLTSTLLESPMLNRPDLGDRAMREPGRPAIEEQLESADSPAEEKAHAESARADDGPASTSEVTDPSLGARSQSVAAEPKAEASPSRRRAETEKNLSVEGSSGRDSVGEREREDVSAPRSLPPPPASPAAPTAERIEPVGEPIGGMIAEPEADEAREQVSETAYTRNEATLAADSEDAAYYRSVLAAIEKGFIPDRIDSDTLVRGGVAALEGAGAAVRQRKAMADSAVASRVETLPEILDSWAALLEGDASLELKERVARAARTLIGSGEPERIRLGRAISASLEILENSD